MSALLSNSRVLESWSLAYAHDSGAKLPRLPGRTAAERAAMSEKFTKIAEAHDMLNRPRNEGVAELQELVPRGTAAAFLCLYWVMHMLMDFMVSEYLSHCPDCAVYACLAHG